MQVFENTQKNWILQVWPTSQREYEKEPFVKFLVDENQKVNVGDVIKAYSHSDKETDKTILYKLTEIINVGKSHFKNKNVVHARFEREVQIVQLNKKSAA